MSGWRRVSRGETNIDFVGLRRRWFVISATVLAISLLALAVRGLNLGLEFEGGAAVQAENPNRAQIAEFRNALQEIGIVNARIQLIDEGESVRVQTGALDPDEEFAMVDRVVETAGSTREEASIETVGPTFGALVARRAVLALGVFLGFAVLFISWRLQWKMALAGIAALIHDLILTVGVYAVTGFEVTPATVVALLTILGYSLYDTVVVFDKVEELEHVLVEDHTYTAIVNRAMNMVLVRSLATSLTSLIPVGSLLFVGALILGASSLRDFALALFVGIGVGTYSSIFVAAPLLAVWKEKEPDWLEQRTRLERRQASRRPAATQVDQAPVRVEEEPQTAPPATSPPDKGPAPGVVPRPPKRRRR